MQENSSSYLFFLLSTILTALAAFSYLIVRHFHKRMSNLSRTHPAEVASEKIIIACEPNNLFFEFSTVYLSGYSEIILPQTGWSELWARSLRLLGRGYFYRLKQSKRNISTFLQTLTLNQKVQLFLYTSLPMEVVELILKRMDLLSYFPKPYRRSCGDFSCEPTKHPIEVDIHTKRVVILTNTRHDHQQEDSMYFLVINQREMSLSKAVRSLDKMINKNRQIDEFHNQLANLKANIESQTDTLS